jgi:hypothetical protein
MEGAVTWHPEAGLPDGIFSNLKKTIWANFGGPWNVKGWYIIWLFGIYYSLLVNFMAIR